MDTIYISAVFLILFQTVASEYNSEICEIFKTSNGLIPPPLPTNFELKGEHVDNNRGSTGYEEMYFDYMNTRAKYMFIHKGIEYHFLYDYNTEQIVKWDKVIPGLDMKRDPLSQVCEAVDMVESKYRNLFGFQDWTTSKPKMYNSNQVLRYGGQYQVAANGSTSLDSRGLHVNTFISCVYDSSVDATLLANFSFSGENVEPSGATEKKDVLGPDEGYLSVPVRMQYVGQIPDETGTQKPFNRTMSVSWFRGDPEFKMGTFQIPPFVYCKDYRGGKDKPLLPTAFTTRIVVTKYRVDTLGIMEPIDSEGYQEIFYYAEKKLAREDFTINPIDDKKLYEKFQNPTPITCIHDFNIGLLYIISKTTGRCLISPIPKKSMFASQEDLLFIKMATPDEIFLMQTDQMEYKGKAFARDIECDVWTGNYYDRKYNSTSVKETYFSTNGWHEESDDAVSYIAPVKHYIIKTDLDSDVMEDIVAYNFLKFRAKPPPLTDFDIKGCIEQINHKTYAIKLSVADDVLALIFKYKYQFLETAQYYLSDIAQVLTPLRVQRLDLRQQAVNNKTPFLVFALLDKVDFAGIEVIQKGADLEEARNNLQRVVDNSMFAIQFNPPGSDEAIIVPAQAGDMYFVKPGGTLVLAPLKSWKRTGSGPVTEEPTPLRKFFKLRASDDDEEEVVEKKGMTPGGLTLLAFAMLFIGVGIGIAVMYLYMRLYSERHIEEKIGMDSRPTLN